MSPEPRVALVAGCGELGSAVGLRLAALGAQVWGIRRRADLLSPPIRALAADLVSGRGLEALPERADWLLYCAAPLVRTPETYRETYLEGSARLLERLAARGLRPARAIFVSSSSVFGDHGGAWVDEDTPPRPEGFQGTTLLEAEQLWRNRLPGAVVVRPSGIYGPRRRWLIERLREPNAHCRRGVYTNRIHIEDLADALVHLLSLPEVRPLYVISDDEPAPECEVMGWLAARLGLPPPPVDELGQRLPTGNKRLSNRRLKATGFRLRYPSFREGYGAMLDSAGPSPPP
ncbi:MAG: SDR family oxidoreductase [Xanthomonadales bacterium]|nr:SDR family oxidoreductase [Xanthomonadales bacterium]